MLPQARGVDDGHNVRDAVHNGSEGREAVNDWLPSLGGRAEAKEAADVEIVDDELDGFEGELSEEFSEISLVDKDFGGIPLILVAFGAMRGKPSGEGLAVSILHC